MPNNSRETSASQLARDYGVSLNEFATAVIDVIVDADPPRESDAHAARRREVCAAVSAAMVLALDASTLSVEERERLEPRIHDVLLPFWRRHCAEDAEGPDYITSRIAHYTARRVNGSQVTSAVNIVQALLESIDVPVQRRAALSERLVPAFAHRLVGDVFRINEVRSRHGIDLPTIASVCALLQMALSCDPVRRALHID